MASGLGNYGGVGRCYPIWSDFVKCLNTKEVKQECIEFRDDYFECLHHAKEFKRYAIIQERKEQLIKDGQWPPKDQKSFFES